MRHISSKYILFVGATLVSIVACAGDANAEIQYTVTDMGTLGGVFTSSASYGINASGQSVGWSYFMDPGLHGHAFLYDGTIRDLGTLGGSDSFAFGINNVGRIAGYSTTVQGDPHAFIYDSAMHDLGTLGGSTSYAAGINASGNVIGTADTADGGQHAFLYDSSMHDLGTLGGNHSSALGVNNGGRVTGSSEISLGVQIEHAFLYDGAMHDLGTLGGSGSAGHGINAIGQVTGVSNTSQDATFHAFLYDGTMHDLGSLGGDYSDGSSINSYGQVTGGSGTLDGTFHAFIYKSATGMVDLNSLIDPLSGWTLASGDAINDAGQITGIGMIGGESHAFLLTPLPEPGSVTLAAVGVVGLLAWYSQGRSRLLIVIK